MKQVKIYSDDKITYDALVAGHINHYLTSSPNQWPAPDNDTLIRQAKRDLKHIRDLFSGTEDEIVAQICDYLLFWNRDYLTPSARDDFERFYFHGANAISKESLDEFVFYGIVQKDYSMTERVKQTSRFFVKA